MSDYREGQKVSLKILRKTNLGYVALVNGADEGLLYHGEVFEALNEGQTLDGYVGKVRPDGRIDLLLQPLGNHGSQDLGARILKALADNKGFLPIDDKTSAEKIHQLFGVSKKKYKMALGHLYKTRQVKIDDDGIRLVKSM